MKQLYSLIASALVSSLIVVGMIGIGVNALTTPGAPVNGVATQVTANPGDPVSQQLSPRTNRSRTETESNEASERTE
jgi:hypothetical protein